MLVLYFLATDTTAIGNVIKSVIIVCNVLNENKHNQYCNVRTVGCIELQVLSLFQSPTDVL